MLRHVFAWKVKDKNDRQTVVDLLTEFSTKVDMVRSFEIGSHSGDPGENGDPWDGVLITDFDDWAGLEEYSHHPAHEDLLPQLLPLVSERAVIDFERGAS